MQLDDLKDAWTAHGATLERSLAINERLLREVLLRKARRAMAPHVIWRALEVAAGVLALLLIVPVLATHVSEPLYFVVAGGLAAFALAITVLCSYLLLKSLELDFGEPVTTIQRKLEHIHLAEYGVLKWAVLGGVVAWLPAALILFEALTGVDSLARADLAWLIGNLLFGLLVLTCGQAASRRYVEHPNLGPRARHFLKVLSGKALQTVTAHLSDLASFEQEESTG